MKFKLTKILIVNVILTFLFLEIMGRVIVQLKKTYSAHSNDLQSYFGWVNHDRSNSYPQLKKVVLPKSTNDTNIYGEYPCSDNGDCPTVLIQGDSWGELLETEAADVFLSDVKARFIMGGTSSFSPSNMAAQLAYLVHEKEISIDYVVAFIDNTDIGDEYCRYKDQLIYPSSSTEFLKVATFSENRQYEHYAIPPIAIAKSSDVHALVLLKEFQYRFKRYLLTNQMIDPNNICSFQKDILSPLEKENRKVNSHFLSIINLYMKTAKRLGIKHVLIVTHPHRRHLPNAKNPYQISVSDLIQANIEDIKSLENFPDFQISHLNVSPTEDQYSAGYFREGDLSSHLTIKGNRSLASKIVVKLNQIIDN